jgi:tetratricopeptide (TPR) repeat protein
VASAKDHAIEVLKRNRNAPLANYVMGSLALQGGDNVNAEIYLRKAADARKPVVLALNDLAEVLRRTGKYDEAEMYARKAVKAAPKLYIAWETLGSILLNANRNIDEAEKCILKACELSRDDKGREEDVRMLISLARVQLAKCDNSKARTTLRKVNKRVSELSEYEKQEFEELRKRAK